MTKSLDADLPYPTIDESLGEKRYPDEQALAGEIARAIEGFIRRKYQAGHARRDAHPKAHGIVKAEFRVNAGIPHPFAKGVFEPGAMYDAWIRFSNGLQDDDSLGDGRGMAIKLLRARDAEILEDDRNATMQDFILFSSPVFFINDPRRYLSLVNATGNAKFWSKLTEAFALGPQGYFIAAKLNSGTISNPLQATYWSAVPYQLGIGPDRKPIKFKVTPRSPLAANSVSRDHGPDYLRAALRTTLEQSDAEMAFHIQPRTSEEQSVEDSMTEWTENDAPFYEVATIHIPRQEFDTPAQNQFAEDISFSPWNGLPEHRPLGVTNRLRKVIYDHMSRVRHEMNATERAQP